MLHHGAMRTRDNHDKIYEGSVDRGLAELLDEVAGDYGEWVFDREGAWMRGHSHKYHGVGACRE